MATDYTTITDGRVRLIKAVAATFVVNGCADLVLVLLNLVGVGVGGGVTLGWIGDMIVGLGLLRFNRRAYIAALWWVSLKLILHGASFICLMMPGGHISQLEYLSSSILAVVGGAVRPSVLVLSGLILLAVWQLWVLSRRYTRLIFGCGATGAAPRRHRAIERPRSAPRRSP